MLCNLLCKGKQITASAVSDLNGFKLIYPKGTILVDGLKVYEVKKVDLRKNDLNELVVTYELKELVVKIKSAKKSKKKGK